MNVYEHILQQIYGKPQLLIDEKRLFLNAIYERVVIAITTEQLNSGKIYKVLLEEMEKDNDLRLWINGSKPYNQYAYYVQTAIKLGVSFTVVHSKRASPFGLVLATVSVPSNVSNPFIEDHHFHFDAEDVLEAS
ncbi:MULTISPECIES: DUF1694 domain-containing protein [Bacillaceae]|uniref:DUF1694 domain-containing protein n=1 Tax=Shouchella oshimensis TaxID=290588 RepID=UPI0006EBEA75|nr:MULTISPECIES: DUF1694 domain-containing protein [Bacillaceae]